VCAKVPIIILHYGVIELRNAGSTDATLAVRKACIQKSRLCKEDVSNSCEETTIQKNIRLLKERQKSSLVQCLNLINVKALKFLYWNIVG
jgi:hypothetical protein